MGLGNRRLQIDRSGPFFTVFLPNSWAIGLQIRQKLCSLGPIFAFGAPSPTASYGKTRYFTGATYGALTWGAGGRAMHYSAAMHIQPPALLLAAGRGERMRPLTDHTPKPLLAVQGLPLLQWHLQALAQAGVARAVINTAWLGEQISDRFSSFFVPKGALDKRKQLSISYSHEGLDFGCALETAGGIARALPRLGPIFWLAAGDVFAPDFRFAAAAAKRFAAGDALAHLWLVKNPEHNPRGDFGLSADGLALNLPADRPGPRHTYSTIALLRAELFAAPWCDIPAGNPAGLAAPLAPLLRRAMDAGRVTAELYTGRWTDVGTPERLATLNAETPTPG